MDFIILWLHKLVAWCGPFLLLLGLLIFVHELGHFLVAKLCRVRVEVFSLGFGKKILRFKKGDTTYCVSLIPLGGYVKMFGDDPSMEIADSEKPHSFLHKPVGQRIAIVLAGPMMNLIFAAFLFSVNVSVGHPVPAPVVGDVAQSTAAYTAGFRSGDKILAVNDHKVQYWSDVKKAIESHAQQPLTFKVQREDRGTIAQITAKPEWHAPTDVMSLKKKVGVITGLDITSSAPLVGIASAGSEAAKAGFHSLDLIESVNGEKIRFWRQLDQVIRRHAGEGKLVFTVQTFTRENDGKDNVPTHQVVIRHFQMPKNGMAPTKALGLEETELYLMAIKPGSPAAHAGLKRGDKILAVNDQKISNWNEVLQTVKAYKAGQTPFHFQVSREGRTVSVTVKPELTMLMNQKLQEEQRFTIGIMPAFTAVLAKPAIQKFSNPIKIATYGIEQSYYWTKMVVVGIVKLIEHKVSSRNIAGVITIGRVANESFAVGITAFFKIMAIVSINLFLINLLPIPILDGGHLMFFSIEAVRGAPLSLRKMEIAQQVGLILMMALMVFALFNDIRNLFAW